MDKETFCVEYCPMPFRGKFRNGDDEVDCDCEEATECPFRDVDFNKVHKYKEPVTEPDGLITKPQSSRTIKGKIISREVGKFESESCPECNGIGFESVVIDGRPALCNECNGTGRSK